MNGFKYESLELQQYLLQKTRAEKRLEFVAGRRHIADIFPDAGLIYKSDKVGQLTHVAYGIVQPVLDARERFSRIQLPTHRFTEWYPFWHPHERLHSIHAATTEALVYIEWGHPLRRAYDIGQPLPDYTWFTYEKTQEEKHNVIIF